jgi:hypothetical protein
MLRVGVVASRRFSQIRGFDFVEVNKKLTTPSARKALSGLRSRHDELKQFVADANKPVPPVDWDYYRANIVDTYVVDAFEKEYDNLEPPKFEDPDAEETDRRISAVMTKAKEMQLDAEARVEQFSKILVELEEGRTGRDTKLEDVVERFPDIAIEARDEIERGDYAKDQPL